MKRYILCLILLGSFLGFHTPVLASKTKPFCSQKEAEKYLRVHYNRGCSHYNHKEWRCAADEFEKVIHFFPNSEEAAEAHYFLGVAYFEMKEFDFSNCSFSKYLTASIEPLFYEDAVYYKFCIAEHFRLGKKRRPLTYRYFPKWLRGETLALTIYDEVAIALPNHDLTVAALYAKGQLLQKMGNFRDAVDTYQTLIKRFPKNELTPDCYLKIAESFCQQSLYEFQNPDILALAELNVRKFKEEFPRDEKTETADGYVCRIKEMYAKGLSDVGLFYERMGQPEAAIIYYQSSIEEFPDTNVAKFCRRRLTRLGSTFEEEEEGLLDEPASPEGEGILKGNNEDEVSFENSEPSREPCNMEVCQEPVDEYHPENLVHGELEPSMYQEQPVNWGENSQENLINGQLEPSLYQEQAANDQEQSLNWNEFDPENLVYGESEPFSQEQQTNVQEQKANWNESYPENSVYGESEPFFYQEHQANDQEQKANWNESYPENSVYGESEPFFYQEQSANDQEQKANWNESYPENSVYGEPESFFYQEQQANDQEQKANWNESYPENSVYGESEPFFLQQANDQEQPINWNGFYPGTPVYGESEYEERPANYQEHPSDWCEHGPEDPGQANDQEQQVNWNESYPENPVYGESELFSLQEQPAYHEQPSDWCEYDPENSFDGESEHFEDQPANYQPSNWFEYDPEPVFDTGRIYQDQPANFQEQPTEWSEFYPPYPSCAPVDMDYDIHTNAVQEEIEAAPAPIYLHYSLLKKRQQVQRCQERRRE